MVYGLGFRLDAGARALAELASLTVAHAPRNRAAMEAELDAHKPSHILCAAGLTGRPNVDWCEANQVPCRSPLPSCLSLPLSPLFLSLVRFLFLARARALSLCTRTRGALLASFV